MRKGVLGSIAALTAGAGLAFGQGPAAPGRPPAGGYDMLVPASGQVAPLPPYLGGGADGAAVIPAGDPAPNGAPTYPPPGMYGATPYQPPGPAVNLGPRFVAPHVWLDTEYLLWWVRRQPINFPVVTTSAPGDQGLIGQPTTQVLVGNCDLGYGLFSGFRVTGGWFKGDDRRLGVEFSGFLLGQKSVNYYAASDANGVPLLARPFVAAGGGQGSLIISLPNVASGNVLFRTTSQSWGAEGSGVLNLYRTCPDSSCMATVNGLLGFRYFELDELIDVASASTLLGSNTAPFIGLTVAAPATRTVEDKFQTTNRFYGGQVGLKAEVAYGKWYLAAVGKFAIGDMNQTIEITGQSGVADPTRGGAAVSPGGLLANYNTICTLRKDEYVYIPEVDGKFGYNWCSWLTTYVGYNFMYVSKVIRPGNQITNVVNTNLVPTSPTYGQGGLSPTPNVLFSESHFWLQGVSFGLLVRF